jgi:transglutaminase-like putative cysteine protease
MSSQRDQNQDNRWWDGLAALLVLFALLTVATRLVVTSWAQNLTMIQTLVLLGGLLGLALGQSRFSGRASFYFSAAYGILLIIWRLGASIELHITWKERLQLLFRGLNLQINLFLRSEPVNDNILFLMLMSVLFWILGVYAGYQMTRWASAWRAVIPAGAALMVIHAYDPLITRRVWFLAVFLLFALMLIARAYFLKQRAGWKENRIYIPPDISFDWVRFTMGVTVLLLLLSFTVPALAETLPPARDVWMRVKQPWDNFSKRASNAFSSLQASVMVVHERYGDSLTLGQGTQLGNTLMLVVEAPEKPLPGLRYYWRAYTYDHYAFGRWTSTSRDVQILHPEEDALKLPEYEGRTLANFTVTPQFSIMTIYGPAQPVGVSIPTEASLHTDREGYQDLVAFNALAPIFASQSYVVEASIATATVSQLQQAGTDYPEWVLDRYLQLPAAITPRTIELAEQIAKGWDNPYDIATAITTYLRNYQYQEIIDMPPDDQELVDWFLFDYEQGFCQYYATAEVVMLRSLGIPARLAVGYAQGEFTSLEDEDDDDPGYLETKGVYRVLNRDAHAWPEVFFPGIGWVEFEPTAGQNPLFRPRGDSLPGADETPEYLFEEELEMERLRQMQIDQGLIPPDRGDGSFGAGEDMIDQASASFRIWRPAALLLLTAAVVVLWRRRSPAFDVTILPLKLERGLRRLGFQPPAFIRRWAHIAELSPVSRSYLEINRALHRLGADPHINDTPAERASSLVSLLPSLNEQISRLLSEYQLSVYSQRRVDPLASKLAAADIRRESYRAFFNKLFRRKEKEDSYGWRSGQPG